MIDPISFGQSSQVANIDQLAMAERLRQMEAGGKVSQEFLTIFYKEMLKQAIKTPDLGLIDDNGEPVTNSFSSINHDILVEQFAKELAKSQAAQMQILKMAKEDQ